MKQTSNIKLIPIYFIIFLIYINSINTAAIRASPYAGDATVHHSLYAEKDNLERMSGYSRGIPLPKEEESASSEEKIAKSSEIVAKKIVDQYKMMFDYLDYKPVDNLITGEELSEAFKDFNWPKITTSVSDDMEYAKVLIPRYDTSAKNSLNFVEFCKLMEELWDSSDYSKEEKCNVAFEKSNDTFIRLFKWLDRDSDTFLEAEDIIYGVSRIMFRDADLKEIQDIFTKYGKEGKLSQDSFLLAIVNGELTKTFKDELVTSTFIK